MKELKTKEDFEKAVGKKVLLDCSDGKGEGWLFKADGEYYVQQDFAVGAEYQFITEFSWRVWDGGLCVNSVHLIEEYQIDPNYVPPPYPLGTMGYVSDESEGDAISEKSVCTLCGYTSESKYRFITESNSWKYFVPIPIEPEPEYFITVQYPDGKGLTKPITKEQWEGLGI